MAVSPDILYAETDARFDAQVAHRPGQKHLPGQKLDPNNPTDKALIPVWKDIYAKVKAEADAGTLVTTYDHPEVAQNLADAAIAHKAAAAHASAAAASPDVATARDNIVAATTAQQISTQKAQEAASKQPPTVSPELVKDAAKEIAKNPPPPQAPASEHIAHEHAHKHAHKHAHDVHAQAQSLKPLYNITDERFWQRYPERRNQKLDMSVPADVELAKVWRQIFQQVQSEANAGTLVLTSPDGTPAAVAPPSEAAPPPPPEAALPPQPAPPPQMYQPPERHPSPLPIRPSPPMRPMPPPGWHPTMPPGWHPTMPPGMQPGMPPTRPTPPPGWHPTMPPGMQPGSHPGMEAPREGHPHHRREPHRRGEGPARPVTAPPTPGMPPAPGTTEEGAPPGDTGEQRPPTDVTSPTKDTSSTEGGLSGGQIAWIVLGGAVVATLGYMGWKRYKDTKPAPSFRSRAPRAVAALPRVSSARMSFPQLPAPARP